MIDRSARSSDVGIVVLQHCDSCCWGGTLWVVGVERPTSGWGLRYTSDLSVRALVEAEIAAESVDGNVARGKRRHLK